MKRILALFCTLLCLCLSLAACGGEGTPNTPGTTTGNTTATVPIPAQSTGKSTTPADAPDSTTPPATSAIPEEPEATEYFTVFDQQTSYGETDTFITFTGTGAEIRGTGAAVEGNVLSVTAPGTYVFSGSWEGQIVVELAKTEKAHLVFCGVTVTCKDGPAVWVRSADKVALTLADGTVNTLTDGTSYAGADAPKAPDACLFSQDDLSLNGSGSLLVQANFNNGIRSKNDLRIHSATVSVTAPKNGIRGDDSLVVEGATLYITAGKDALKVTNTTESNKGYFILQSGSLTLAAGDDGIQAVTALRLLAGRVTYDCTGKKKNCPGEITVAPGVQEQ